ncbi:hypothetical protein F5X99DRAFT_412232 [Biscogniauxia marginata]|nr:hypothetical protein F5X99DRAFT_412232 [Biscogniauxia marginata]
MTLPSQDSIYALCAWSCRQALNGYHLNLMLSSGNNSTAPADGPQKFNDNTGENESDLTQSSTLPAYLDASTGHPEDTAGIIMGSNQSIEPNIESGDLYLEAEKKILSQGHVLPTWAVKQKSGARNDDSDASDQAFQDYNSVYDSDLDSEVSGTDYSHREHHKKMRKWKSLSTNKYENTLLDCIVNTGNYPAENLAQSATEVGIREFDSI